MADIQNLLVPELPQPIRLDAWLAAELGSRTAAARAVKEGRVLVGNEKRAKSFLLHGSESVQLTELEVQEAPEPSEQTEIPVVFEDAHLMVVEKPAGMVVHPAPGHATGTLAQLLAGSLSGGEEGRAGIVHRLDQDTTGLLIVARTEDAHRQLRQMLEKREVKRIYTALVDGAPPTREGTITAPIGRDRRVRTRMSTTTDTPRDATTHFTVDTAFAHSTLLTVQLETGRTHQIRVHLKTVGLPVIGDPEYGIRGGLGLSRQFLHAAQLEFTHPITGEELSFTSALPPDLDAALARARAGEQAVPG